jgi:hypothetical protein
MSMFLHVDGVTHLQRYELRLSSTTERSRTSISRQSCAAGFEPLRDPRVLGQVQVNPETGTIEWPNGADFAPEFLFDAGTTVHELA